MAESEDEQLSDSDDETTQLSEERGSDTVETVVSGRSSSDPKVQVQRLGRYRLIAQLGQGGQGAVYLAEDERLRRQVALKILYGGLAHSPEARLRFEREAEVTGRLNHSAIASVYEIGEEAGVPYIAMELVEGQTLADRLADARQGSVPAFGDLAPSPPKGAKPAAPPGLLQNSAAVINGEKALRAAALFVETCARALHVAHEAGLVHRDIKPGNIMVRADQSPCLLDFGLVHDQSAANLTLTASNDSLGTPTYMAPEQVRGRSREVDRRTDIWALGAVLYECCSLRRPFEAPTRDQLFELIKNAEPVAPRLLNPNISRDLEAIILTALDKDQNRRYASAEQMAEDLRRFRELEPVRARPAGRALKTWRWCQRNRAAAIAAGSIVLVLLAAALNFYLKSEEAQRAQDRAEQESRAKSAALSRETAALKEKSEALQERERALSDYDRLADVKRLEAATEAAALLYPPSLDLLPSLEAWQAEHGRLVDRLPDHEAFLKELRHRALDYSLAERSRDFADELMEKAQLEEALVELNELEAVALNDVEAAAAREKQAEVESRLTSLNEEMKTRRSWRFADQSLQFQHDVLTELVKNLAAFANDLRGPTQVVARRMEQSRSIAKATLAGEMAERWTACRERIRGNTQYVGLTLSPQLGLIPLGPDPDSGLEEFLHWLSHEGPLPERNADQRVEVTEAIGVILVLIPGGRFLMGSQGDDPNSSNFDANSMPAEGPLHEVALDAYFIAKYEMTQGQWRRISLLDPSRYNLGANHPSFPAAIDERHPVEQVSWDDAQEFLPQVGLALPTAAEWECAARAGSDSTIYSGCSLLSDLSRYANICGAEAGEVGFSNSEAEHRDAFVVHAPVGSFAPNAFGLYDMTGNVFEWCLDGSSDSYQEPPGARGLRDDPKRSRSRALRGGSFNGGAVNARLANRLDNSPDNRANNLGLRALRLVQGDN